MMRMWLVMAGLVMLTGLQQAAGVEFSTVEFAGKTFTVCRVNVQKEHLDLFHRDDHGQPLKQFANVATWLRPQGRKLVFAMNAGMFHSDFSAVGLFVSGGRQLVPLNTANGDGNFFLKPNGVFVQMASGARVVESSEYPKLTEPVILATQSGPLLVRAGRLHPAFREGSDSRLVRNGVGVPSPGTAIFVMSEVPVNFYEFATFFRDQLHCPDALFLDGTISSIFSTALKRYDFRMNLGPIIGVT